MLLEMDSTLAKDDSPFNSAHRLQALVSKCGNSKEHAMWVLRHMAHMVAHLAMSASSAGFSVDGLQGSPRTGNRGLVGAILVKKEALGYLCHMLPAQLGIEGDATWLSDLRVSLADHSSHLASRKGDGLAWRTASRLPRFARLHSRRTFYMGFTTTNTSKTSSGLAKPWLPLTLSRA